MGRDKALLPFRGQPLAASVARVLTEAAGCAVLVGGPPGLGALGYPVLPDLFPGEGPLGGILTALSHTTADWNLLVACDMPELTPPFLAGLLAAAEESGADVLLPFGPSGLPEPLCAVYRREIRRPLAAAFDLGVRKITAAFEGLRVVHFSVPELKPLQNVNTPQDWTQYAG